MIKKWSKFNESLEDSEITLEHVMKLLYFYSMSTKSSLIDDAIEEIVKKLSISPDEIIFTYNEERKIVVKHAEKIFKASKDPSILNLLETSYENISEYVDWINFEDTLELLVDFEDYDYQTTFDLSQKGDFKVVLTHGEDIDFKDFLNNLTLVNKKLPRLAKLQDASCHAYVNHIEYNSEGETTIEILVKQS
jgi:hypothetical protein